MTSPRDLSVCLANLKGLRLSRVTFGPAWVQVEFTGEYNAFLEINKTVDLTDQRHDKIVSFNPVGTGIQLAAAELVAMRDGVVELVELSQQELKLGLSGYRDIRVSLDSKDFEPVLFSGSHHLSPSQLAWHFVVTSSAGDEA